MSKSKLYYRLLILISGCFFLNTSSARELIPFNTEWEFKKGPFPEDAYQIMRTLDSKWGSVNIPHTWNAVDMQNEYNRFYQGVAYYRKHFIAPDSMKGKKVYLRFEGVGTCAEIYVNGNLVGTHKGAYAAFVVEIDRELKIGYNNEVMVKVDNQSRLDVIPVNHILFGVYGGIYRPISLIVTDLCHIAVNDYASPGVYITQNNVFRKSANINIKVKVENNACHSVPVELENLVFNMEGRLVDRTHQSFKLTSQGMQSYNSSITIRIPHLWQGRQDPYLYKVITVLKQNGKVIDKVIQPLGLRHYEIIAGKGFYLNGVKYPMYGVTRHQDWSGIGSALKNENHDVDLAMIMDVGATTVRFAHYQQSEYVYSRCDSLGLIIWCEIPFVNKVTGQESENAQYQLRELIRQNFNHPSIYIWGLHNEVYKPYCYTAQLTSVLHDIAKSEDPDRYTVSVNGYGGMDHPVNLRADVQGMNRYYGWYEGRIKDIDQWIEGLERNFPDQKFILSEYGADGNIYQQTEYLDESLNWMKPYYPETFQTKVHEYQWSVIAKHPYIIASYLWNSFDFATPMANRGGIPARNMKGMVTFDRKVKKDIYFWYKANWSNSPVLYMTQRRNIDRERKHTEVTVYSNQGEPVLYLNGRKQHAPRSGFTRVHYIFDDITLDEGKNILKAVVNHDGKTYQDEIEWYYSGEKNRGPEKYIYEQTHGGLS